MKEIICVNVGQAGIHIGNAFWELMALEHGISLDGLRQNPVENDNPLSLFYNTQNNSDGFYDTKNIINPTDKLTPRCISVDLEIDTSIEIQKGPYRSLFPTASLISGKQGGCLYTTANQGKEAKKVQEQVFNRIKFLAETCENLQGFMIFTSIAGGTGSGLTAAICKHIAETYGKVPSIVFSLFPSSRLSSSPIEPYNAILSQQALREYTDLTILFDNEAIYNILSEKLEVPNPSYTHINRLIAQVASSITSSTRFEGSTTSVKEILSNLVTYPVCHFALPAYSPLSGVEKLFHEQPSVYSITDALFDPDYAMATCDYTSSHMLACCANYRGDVSQYDINCAIEDVKAKRKPEFVSFAPRGIKSWITNAAPVVVPYSDLAKTTRTGTILMNSCAISGYFTSLIEKFDKLYSKRAFTHWFHKDDFKVDIKEAFSEGKQNLEILATDYAEVSKP